MTANIPDKLTFTKREVVNITRLDGKVLDYWEKEFAMLNPVVNQNGDKFFSRKDIDIILRIKELLMGEKKSREEAKAALLHEFESPPVQTGMIGGKKPKPDIDLSTVKEGLEEILTLIDKDDK